MLKQAAQEVERSSQLKRAADHEVVQDQPEDLDSDAMSADGIDDEFDRNVG